MFIGELIEIEKNSQIKMFDRARADFMKQNLRDSESLVAPFRMLRSLISQTLKEEGAPIASGVPLASRLQANTKRIRKTMIVISQCLNSQRCLYRQIIQNYPIDKQFQQEYFRTILELYNSKRKYLKDRLLQLQEKFMRIQQIINKDPSRDHYEFTQFGKYISLEHVESYNCKLIVFDRIMKLLNHSTALKAELRDRIALLFYSKGLELPKREQKVQQPKANTTDSTIVFTVRNRDRFLQIGGQISLNSTDHVFLKKHQKDNRSFFGALGEDPVTSLIRAAEIRQSREEIKVQFLRAKLQSLTARNKSLKKENECFEKAIQKLVSIVDQKREEYKLIECVHAGKHGLGKTGRAITNTDYLIYLKQLHRSIANKNKIGFYFHQRRRILEQADTWSGKRNRSITQPSR